MKYRKEFDKVIDRSNTGSLKYDTHDMFKVPHDILSLWVADMDFKAPDFVQDKLKEAAEFGIFGYSITTEEYFEAVRGWFERRFGWQVERKWLVQTPGVVFALATAVKAYTEPGDGVVIQPPVYYPFSNVIRRNDRVIVENTLVYEDGKYTMDFEDLEAKLSEERNKLMILCSPHNPVGRVWTKEEVTKVAELCLAKGVKLVSDEIHCDFVFGENRQTPVGTLSEEIRNNTVICTAPSKTFNMAGLQVSNIFIQDAGMRTAFKRELNRIGFGWANILGMTACKAAYEDGDEWVDDLVWYIGENIRYIEDFVSENMPEIKVIDTQGTYLVWIDLHGLGLTREEQEDFIVNKAKLWLDTGTMFGEAGEGFERLNAACPRATLEEGMNRLKAAYDQLKESRNKE
ncbi:MAG: pyridoxal phosphate-dependent aminotransferase [Firmicutes bacterium]|nr:pyridoxal phosphate-dependent aminotransferase [Bacillota bacterium]